jgi:hypothetical protein
VTIPEAGHASNQDNPQAFTAELAAFLDRELASGERVADQLVHARESQAARA